MDFIYKLAAFLCNLEIFMQFTNLSNFYLNISTFQTISPGQYDGEELASFSLDHLSFGGLLSNSGQMDMFLKLQSISLVDSRPNSNLAVKKLVHFSLIIFQ